MEQTPTQDQLNLSEPIVTPAKSRCSLVRFSAEQFERIKGDARSFGQSIPELLRSAYFGRKKMMPRFSISDADRIVAAINRVGNNVNQIAKHLNSGFREGFQPLLEEAVLYFVGIKAEVTVGHERR